MIQVTKTFLPELDAYVELLRGIWATGQVTNHGELVTRLEGALSEALGARNVLLVCNGTIALQIAIRALRLRGPVVTTPFSYVATTSSLVWEGCSPVFADIDPDSLCLDPQRAEEACARGASGILATHVYGNACAVEELAQVARRHGLPIIYDAAHAFAAKYQGRSLCAQGEISVLSLHATKLFHSGEGGALVTDDDSLAHEIRYLRNFGHNGPEAFFGLGINGKMSELHAAMGLAVLPHVPAIVSGRRALAEAYDQTLAGAPATQPLWRNGLERNYAYYPVLFRDEAGLLSVRAALNERGIFPRRYFYPALSALPYVGHQRTPVSEDAANRVLCLPMGHDVSPAMAMDIAELVQAALLPRHA